MELSDRNFLLYINALFYLAVISYEIFGVYNLVSIYVSLPLTFCAIGIIHLLVRIADEQNKNIDRIWNTIADYFYTEVPKVAGAPSHNVPEIDETQVVRYGSIFHIKSPKYGKKVRPIGSKASELSIEGSYQHIMCHKCKTITCAKKDHIPRCQTCDNTLTISFPTINCQACNFQNELSANDCIMCNNKLRNCNNFCY